MVSAGTPSAFSAGCHRHRPLIEIRSRVGVVSRYALSRSQTARTSAGSGASSAAEAGRADSPVTSSQTTQTTVPFTHVVANRFMIAFPCC